MRLLLLDEKHSKQGKRPSKFDLRQFRQENSLSALRVGSIRKRQRAAERRMGHFKDDFNVHANGLMFLQKEMKKINLNAFGQLL
jgi:hypothetical protein